MLFLGEKYLFSVFELVFQIKMLGMSLEMESRKIFKTI